MIVRQDLFALPKARSRFLVVALAVGITAVVLLGLFMTNAARADVDGPAVQVYSTVLTAADEVPPNDSTASGYAALALDSDGTTLYYRVLVNDIDNITAAHIHEAAAGSNGGVVFTLFDGTGSFDPSSPISGSLTLTPTQVTALQSGNYYINVHTSEVGSGEIRGQIESHDPNGDYNALMLGNNEVPAVTTDAAGVANFTLTNTTTLSYTLTVADIMTITAAHLHQGAAGETGPPVLTLYNGTGSFDPDNPLDAAQSIGAETIVDMLTGYIYVNVHTSENPGGEIRGQVGTVSAYEVDLSGDNEVPAVSTDASGSGVLALSADTETLYYRLMVNDIMTITAAHIHQGAAGENGPPVFTLYNGTGSFDTDNPIDGSVTLTVGQVMDLITGNFYVNVHTDANPGGELRDQISPYSGTTSFNVPLGGEQEVPPVTTDASGTASIHYDTMLNKLFYNVQVSDIMNVIGAHIHQGPVGVNGPVVFSLIDSGETLAVNDPVGGGEFLSAENVVDLLTGYHYINVHTDSYPNGEIRGQIVERFFYYLPLIANDSDW